MKKLQKRENALQTVEQFYVPCDCYCDCACHASDLVKTQNRLDYAPTANERSATKSILN